MAGLHVTQSRFESTDQQIVNQSINLTIIQKPIKLANVPSNNSLNLSIYSFTDQLSHNQSNDQSIGRTITPTHAQPVNRSNGRTKKIHRSINQSIDRTLNHKTTNQPTNQLDKQSNTQSINQPINPSSVSDQAVNQSIKPLNDKLVNQSIDRKMNVTNQPTSQQAINQSIKQLKIKSTTHQWNQRNHQQTSFDPSHSSSSQGSKRTIVPARPVSAYVSMVLCGAKKRPAPPPSPSPVRIIEEAMWVPRMSQIQFTVTAEVVFFTKYHISTQSPLCTFFSVSPVRAAWADR